MASVGMRVFVLGGESSFPGRAEDPNVVHVLDTSSFIILLLASSPIFLIQI